MNVESIPGFAANYAPSEAGDGSGETSQESEDDQSVNNEEASGEDTKSTVSSKSVLRPSLTQRNHINSAPAVPREQEIKVNNPSHCWDTDALGWVQL